MEKERIAVLERVFDVAKEWRSTRLVVKVMRLNPHRTTPADLKAAEIDESRAKDALAKMVDEAAALEEAFEI